MALSKTNRIIILLVVDTAFFLLELIVGYAVHSLALVADSFHMLNDVLSLCVGLWAVKVANRETDSKMYTYGWQRAETLGALVNGVFLVALCMSIFLEAIQRLVEPQVVLNPKLVMIVGCLGLVSNILGLVLFHDHSHGGHGETQDGEDADIEAAEHGHSAHPQSDPVLADERGSAASVLPENRVGVQRPDIKSTKTDQSRAITEPDSPQSRRRRDTQTRSGRRFSSSTGRGFSVDDINFHPATLRHDIIAASRTPQFQDDTSPSDSEYDRQDNDDVMPSERSTLLRHKDRASNYTDEEGAAPFKIPDSGPADDDVHQSHNHAQPKQEQKHHHGHDLNMRGVFLHVMGDALGNIGVIVSALIIWLTKYSWRYYVDPGISLVITVIILCSAVPLCKAASRILLQAVPPGLSIDHIKEDIERLPGIVGSHHLHVWQLSDTKIVASIHIQVDCQIQGAGSERYMRLARQVRKCLHAYGIHSSTIQPEFTPVPDEGEGSRAESSYSIPGEGSASSKLPSRAASVREGDPQACLLECGEECARGGQCCPKPANHSH